MSNLKNRVIGLDDIYQHRSIPDVMTINEMCQVLGISTKTGYKLLKNSKIQHIKVGRAYRITKTHLLVYLNVH